MHLYFAFPQLITDVLFYAQYTYAVKDPKQHTVL